MCHQAPLSTGPKTMTVGEFFNSSDYQQLEKPDYQRPYEWTPRNVRTLLEDLLHFQQEKAQGYRLGCIILCRNEKEKLEIVDGQQRLVTLWLIRRYLNITAEANLVDAIGNFNLDDATSKNSLKNAWFAIKDWMESHSAAKDDLKQLLSSSRYSSNPKWRCVEIVVIQVTNREEAFQLFDSQNSRGKPLKVHNYLKARHLGCMSPEEQQHANSYGLFEGWMDAEDSDKMEILLNRLFKIGEWSHRRTRTQLTESNMDQFFYGFMDSDFSYQKHYVPSVDYFELGRPFKAGEEFFWMIKYFRCLSQQIEDCCFSSDSENGRTKIKSYYNELQKWEPNGKGAGWPVGQLEPCLELFRTAALLYCNRFGPETFPEKADILFLWALSLRYVFIRIRSETLDDFAVGNWKDWGLQPIVWFERMSQALTLDFLYDMKQSPQSVLAYREKHKDSFVEAFKYQQLKRIFEEFNHHKNDNTNGDRNGQS